jgi:type I restriction enzyme, S subunit
MVTKNNHWPVRPIGDIGQVLGGRQRSHRITAGSPRPYLRVANVFDGYIDYRDVLEMPFTDDEFRKFALQPGDILFNEGQSLELVGRNARFDGPPNKFAFQNTLVRFRAGKQITTDYATQLFKYLFIRLLTWVQVVWLCWKYQPRLFVSRGRLRRCWRHGISQ